MKRKAVEPLKEGGSVRVPVDARLRLENFTGELMFKWAERGNTLVVVFHADQHKPFFAPDEEGWDVT